MQPNSIDYEIGMTVAAEFLSQQMSKSQKQLPDPQPSTSTNRKSISFNKISFSAEAIDKIHLTVVNMDQNLLKDTIIHSCSCKALINCPVVLCKSIKFVIGHTLRCTSKAIDGCKLCKHVVSLFERHSRFCQNDECDETFCKGMKMKMRAKRIAAMVQKRVREENFTARRMQLMEMMCQNNRKIQTKTYMLRRKNIKKEIPDEEPKKNEQMEMENERFCF